ncbi:MAG: Spy/CpxP family protein refolding chaperone [Pseudomonadota bacterium]
MTTNIPETPNPAVRDRARPGRTRRWLKVAALLGVGAVTGSIATGAFNAYAHRAMHGMWHHGGERSIEEVRERASERAAWVVDWVDATEAQKADIKSIMAGTVDRLYPLVERHRGNRDDLMQLLSRPDLDEEALEALRQSELRLIDEGSAALTSALAEAVNVLTPEQRQELLSKARRFRGHGNESGRSNGGDN